MTVTTADQADAAQLRDELTGALLEGGWITDERVEAAFRAVPRHLFAPPGISLQDAYADDVIRIKFDLNGTCMSPVSAGGCRRLQAAAGGCRRP